MQQVQWIFPHVWIYLEVEDEQGQVRIWAMEGANPNSILLAGVNRDHIRSRRQDQRALPPVA